MKPHYFFSFIAIAIACSVALSPKIEASNSDWTDGQAADVVLGQPDFDSGANAAGVTGLFQPTGMAVDPATGKVFVSDASNNRILRFGSYEALTSGAAAEAVIGQPDFVTVSADTTQSKLNSPAGIFVDQAGRLWVADSNNARVLRFDNAATIANGANANAVIGQIDFTSDEAPRTPNASSMDFPSDVALSPEGNLFVSDTGYHRVLRYDSAAGKNGAVNADSVFFQPGFESSGAGSRTADRVDFPDVIELGPGGILWIGDSNNSRVLRVDDRDAVGVNHPADAVIAFADFVTDSIAQQPGEKLSGCSGLLYDASRDVLYIADNFRHRILVLENGATASGGIVAGAVLGQPDFATTTSGLSSTKLQGPRHMALDKGGRLWVADLFNNRMLRFSPNSALRDVQPDLTVGPKPNRQKGNNRYNTNGAGQVAKVRAKVRAKGRKKVKFIANLQNDGYTTYPGVVKGSKKNKFFKVKYRGPGGNVTAAMIRGGVETAPLAANGSIRLRADVKPTARGAAKGKTYKGRVTANDSQNRAADAVRYQVKVRK